MSNLNTNEGSKSEGLKCSFYSSDDARSFGLVDASRKGVCLVYVVGESDKDALTWLESFLKERFDRVFSETREEGQKRSLVTFFQSAHADLFREKAKWPQGLPKISLVAAHFQENTIEIASVGTCAAYRVTLSGIERIIPSEGNGGESCYLGASLKVSVEMVKRSLVQGVSYLLTSKRIDLSANWTGNVIEALKLAGADGGAAIALLFGKEGGAFGALESSECSDEEASETGTLGTDVRWYKRLREEMAGVFHGQSAPGGTEDRGESAASEPPMGEGGSGEAVGTGRPRKGLVPFVLKSAPLMALIVALGAAGYVFWAKGGGEWALGVLNGNRADRDAGVAGRTLRSTISLSSIPPGAEVVLDDSVIAARTPVSRVTVAPGTHQIAMRLGELGEWTGNVAVRPGDTANVSIAFVGEIAVNSRPVDGLSVILDGEPRGFTPCVLESVPAGIHVVKVEGKGFSTWEEEVLVTQGSISEIEVTPGKLPETGLVQVTARHVSEEGYEESNGRGVFVDGRKVGATPLKTALKPGYHSIRVVGTKEEPPSVTVIQVRPGGKHFIRAEFAGVQPIVVDCLETHVPSSGQAIIYASLSGSAEAEISRVELYLEKLDSSRAGWEAMALLPGSHSIYAAAVPGGFASGSGQLRYFVRVTTSEGLEYFSEVSAFTPR